MFSTTATTATTTITTTATSIITTIVIETAVAPVTPGPDLLTLFVRRRLVVGPGWAAPGKTVRVKKVDLVDAFNTFCVARNERPWKASKVLSELADRGLTPDRLHRANGISYVLNVTLR